MNRKLLPFLFQNTIIVGRIKKLIYTIEEGVDEKNMLKRFVKIFIIEFLIVLLILLYLFSKYNKYNIPILNNLIINENSELNENQEIYTAFEKKLLEGEEEIQLRNKLLFKDSSEIFNILEEISNDNPEIMYYKGAEHRFGSLRLMYSRGKEEIKDHIEEIRKIRNNFISNYILPGMSDYEKALTIHDYIITNSRYDNRLLTTGTVPPESYTSYGILSLGVGVCEGYAKAMKYLLDGVGVKSTIVVGESKGQSHAWNLVEIEGEYYHIDSTWDDPVTKDGSDVLRYNFLNLNDSEISRTHNWKKENYPEAKGEKFNYFKYNNLVVKDEEELAEKIKSILLRGESYLLVKIIDYSSDKISINKLVEKIVYDNYKSRPLDRYTYSIDEEYGIMELQFDYKK